MTAAPERPTTAHSPYPTRFREAEDRSRRIGRTLKAVARVDEVDEQLMDRLGRGYLERDELYLTGTSEVALAGYPVGLTIAPIMPVPQWRDGYGALLRDVADAVAGGATMNEAVRSMVVVVAG